jgi:hypothetical protein
MVYIINRFCRLGLLWRLIFLALRALGRLCDSCGLVDLRISGGNAGARPCLVGLFGLGGVAGIAGKRRPGNVSVAPIALVLPTIATGPTVAPKC